MARTVGLDERPGQMTLRGCIAIGLVLLLFGTVSCGRKAPLLPVPDDLGESRFAAYSGQGAGN